jgi:hypothetical protein
MTAEIAVLSSPLGRLGWFVVSMSRLSSGGAFFLRALCEIFVVTAENSLWYSNIFY